MTERFDRLSVTGWQQRFDRLSVTERFDRLSVTLRFDRLSVTSPKLALSEVEATG